MINKCDGAIAHVTSNTHPNLILTIFFLVFNLQISDAFAQAGGLTFADPKVQQGNSHKVEGKLGNDFTNFLYLLGPWEAETEGGKALLGKLEISKNTMSWDGATTPRCHTQYVVEARPNVATILKDGLPEEQPVNKRVYFTYLLKVIDVNCSRVAAFIEISTLSDVDNVIKVTLYNKNRLDTASFLMARFIP